MVSVEVKAKVLGEIDHLSRAHFTGDRYDSFGGVYDCAAEADKAMQARDLVKNLGCITPCVVWGYDS